MSTFTFSVVSLFPHFNKPPSPHPLLTHTSYTIYMYYHFVSLLLFFQSSLSERWPVAVSQHFCNLQTCLVWQERPFHVASMANQFIELRFLSNRFEPRSISNGTGTHSPLAIWKESSVGVGGHYVEEVCLEMGESGWREEV